MKTQKVAKYDQAPRAKSNRNVFSGCCIVEVMELLLHPGARSFITWVPMQRRLSCRSLTACDGTRELCQLTQAEEFHMGRCIQDKVIISSLNWTHKNRLATNAADKEVHCAQPHIVPAEIQAASSFSTTPKFPNSLKGQPRVLHIAVIQLVCGQLLYSKIRLSKGCSCHTSLKTSTKNEQK